MVKCARVAKAAVAVDQVAETSILVARMSRTSPDPAIRIAKVGKAKVRTSLNNRDAVKHADIVIAAASAHTSIVDVASLKPGAIVCDIGYPKNISYSRSDRQDILVFSGGICEIPCEFRSAFDHGLPTEKILYGCFSEAIVLALEERFERFSWGKGGITREKMAEILGMALKHGFRPARFFWGVRLVSEDEIRSIRAAAL
jgi:fatty aldehyde-generating acyl-ACP reductase